MNKKDNAGDNRAFEKQLESKYNQKNQTSKMKNEIGQIEEFEDSTKYGEFISSYFSWMTLEGQKRKAKELENKTKQS
ncbi:MAG: hypothetical protein IJ777_03665 [Clostridia bacterium]|nr:hypothetical protein [Clostridia bacterium]